MMARTPFAYIAKVVDELYDRQFDPDDTKGIEAHCEFIAAYLNANGWTEDDYIYALMDEKIDDKTKLN